MYIQIRTNKNSLPAMLKILRRCCACVFLSYLCLMHCSFSATGSVAERWGRINYNRDKPGRSEFASSWTVYRKKVSAENLSAAHSTGQRVYSFEWNPTPVQKAYGLEHRSSAFMGNFMLPQSLAVTRTHRDETLHVRTLWHRSPLTGEDGAYLKGTAEWLKRAEGSVFTLLQAFGEYDWGGVDEIESQKNVPIFFSEIPNVEAVYKTQSQRPSKRTSTKSEFARSKVTSLSFEFLRDLHRGDDKIFNNNSFVEGKIQWGMVSDNGMPPVYSTFVSDFLKTWSAGLMDSPQVTVLTETQHGWGNQIPFRRERIEIIRGEKNQLGLLDTLVEYPEKNIDLEVAKRGLAKDEAGYEKGRNWKWRYELRMGDTRETGEVVGHRRKALRRYAFSELVFSENSKGGSLVPQRVTFSEAVLGRENKPVICYHFQDAGEDAERLRELVRVWTWGMYAAGVTDTIVQIESRRKGRSDIVPTLIQEWPGSTFQIKVMVGGEKLDLSGVACGSGDGSKDKMQEECQWIWHRKVFHREAPLGMFVANLQAGLRNENVIERIWRYGDFWRGASLSQFSHPIQSQYSLEYSEPTSSQLPSLLSMTRLEPKKGYFQRRYVSRTQRSREQQRAETNKSYIPPKTKTHIDQRIMGGLDWDQAMKLADAMSAIQTAARHWVLSVQAKPGTPLKWDDITPFIDEEFRHFEELPRHGGGIYDLGEIGGTIRYRLPKKAEE